MGASREWSGVALADPELTTRRAWCKERASAQSHDAVPYSNGASLLQKTQCLVNVFQSPQVVASVLQVMSTAVCHHSHHNGHRSSTIQHASRRQPATLRASDDRPTSTLSRASASVTTRRAGDGHSQHRSYPYKTDAVQHTSHLTTRNQEPLNQPVTTTHSLSPCHLRRSEASETQSARVKTTIAHVPRGDAAAITQALPATRAHGQFGFS